MRELKNCGIAWIGAIPTDWRVGKVKHAFIRKNAKAMQDDPIILSLARSGVRVRDISNNEGQIAESYFNYNPVEPGDFLLNPMDLYSGANCSISNVSGVISPAYINLRAKAGYVAKYYDYYFKTQYWAMALFAHGKGVSFDNRWTLSVETLFDYAIPIPPTAEQIQIVEFLDKQCSEIDALITRTKDSVAEYKKLKQAVITQAVSKGVRGERPMRSCEYSWINQYPADWSVAQLKNYAALRSGITLGKKYPYGTDLIEVPYLRVANVQGDHIDTGDIATMAVTAEEIEKYGLKANELLLTEGGDRDKLGRGSIWHGEISPCLHQNHVFAVTTDESKLRVRFLDYVTSAESARIYFDLTAKKTTNLACTNSTTIMRFRFAVPPIGEQDEIVAYLDEKCLHLNSLISKKEKVIKELETLKKTVVYEYVTGKKEISVEPAEPVVAFIDARALLVCRIVELMKPKGRIHLQKAMHMVDCLLGLNNETQYSRHKHGPYDVRIQEYEQAAEKKGWIKVKQGSSVEYSAGAKIEDYRDAYLSLYGDVDSEIQRICTFLAPMKTSQSERVATLLAAWNDFLLDGVNPTDQQLIQEVRTNWTPNKANSPEATWLDTLNKIRKNGFVPAGKGLRTITAG